MSPEDLDGDEPFDLVLLDDATVDRILDDRDPNSAPAGYVNATRTLAAASAHATAVELAAEAVVLAAYRRTMMGIERSSRWRRVVRRLGRPRVAAAVVAIVLTVDGGLAAAGGGALPAPAQRVASEVLGVVGIKVPNSSRTSHSPKRGPSHPPRAGDDGFVQGPDGSPVNPSPPSTLGSQSGGTITGVSPESNRLQPAAGATGVVAGGTRSGITIGGSGYRPAEPANAGRPAGPRGWSGNSGNGNGNAWGHANQSAPPGPRGWSGNNGNANAWGQVNTSAAPPGQSASNSNSNPSGHLNNSAPAGPSGQSNSGKGNAGGTPRRAVSTVRRPV